ncbi:MAG: helix-turn-helix transcriptional regulator [Lentisphaerae bacterium]|nr:helix-turn-helix transcriptional regulator [Lentisphaerota bacterium]
MMLPDRSLLRLAEPRDYFQGRGRTSRLPVPVNILLFLRTTVRTLQQKALLNRSHSRFVLILNLRTPGIVHVDHRTLPLGPGRSLLVHPFQFHHYSHLAAPGLQWLFCTFELSHGALLEPLRYRVVTLDDDARSAWRALLETWHGEDRGGGLQGALLQTALLRLLLTLRLAASAQAADLPPAPQDHLPGTVNRLMSERRGRPLGAADIAAAVGLSVSRLRAVFRQTAGVPLGRYMLNYRLNRAMALLHTTDLPIAEIATEAGFGSPQAFSRVFRSKLQMTPRAYRRRPGLSAEAHGPKYTSSHIL